jgi:hypothetical protein
MKLQICTRREVLKMMKYLLFTALTLFFSINHAVAALDEISIVGSLLVLLYVRKAAQNIARIDEFAATSLGCTSGRLHKILPGSMSLPRPPWM